jgi:hypothetical protein
MRPSPRICSTVTPHGRFVVEGVATRAAAEFAAQICMLESGGCQGCDQMFTIELRGDFE